MPESTLPPMLKIPEVASALSVSRTTIYELVRSGKLASIRIGGCRRVPAEALAAYIAGQVAA